MSRRRRRLTIGIVVVQIAIPSILLAQRGNDSRPAPFGWQMYSDHGDRWAAEVEFADGSAEAIDVDSLLVRPRVELDLEPSLGEYLCRTVDGAAAVRVWFGRQRSDRTC